MATIHTLFEGARGCGYRKPGGLYLVTDGQAKDCGLFPIPLHTCPTCSAGIKPARGWTWVDVAGLMANMPEDCITDESGSFGQCARCPLSFGRRFGFTQGKAGLLWIGEAFYKTTQDWLREAVELGISRRIHAIPREFVLGKTWVLVAHRKAIPNGEQAQPGIIAYFKPERIEYVVTGKETEEELDSLEKRGLTLVNVVQDQQSLI